MNLCYQGVKIYFTPYYIALLLSIYSNFTFGASVSDSNKKPTVQWLRPGTLSHQSLHSVLVSMEERLRGLENMKYTTNRLDLYLERFTRQLDSLDVRTRTVQIKLEQLETVAQNIVTHELKNDLSTSHLHSKFETNQDRLIHKIGLTENRLDSSITKLQGTIDLGFEKSEKKQNEMDMKLNTMTQQLDDITQRLIKIENTTNITTNSIHHNKVPENDANVGNMNKMVDMLKGIEKHVNQTIQLYHEQNDSPHYTRHKEHHQQLIKEILRTELHSETNKIANKINNMYNDLWSKTLDIENIVRDVAVLSNQTKFNHNQDDDGLQSSQDIRCTETIQSVTEDLLGTLGSFLREKLETMDTNVEGVYASHKMLLGTYNKMRDDSNKFENRLTYVLGKILDTIDNRTKGMDEMQLRTLEAIKSHNSQIVRTVAYNTNTVKKLTEDNGIDHKNIHHSINHLLNIMTMDKNDSQEYEDNDQTMEKRRKHENKQIKTDTTTQRTENQTQHHRLPDHIRMITSNNNHDSSNPVDSYHHSPNYISIKDNHGNQNLSVKENHKHSSIIDKTLNSDHHSSVEKDEHRPPVIYTEDNIADFDGPSQLEDENDKITRLLMLYLKTLRGHLTKDKFLYEANPQQPYSSIQEMVKKLKELNFPSDFLKELEEWDNETNKDLNEPDTDGELDEMIDKHHQHRDLSHSDDYEIDKDYLDYPVKDSNH